MISFSSFAMSGSSVSMLMLLVKATLILVVALGITLAMQRASAGARHLVWLVTLAALLLVPALTAWSPIPLRILPPTAKSTPTLAPSEAASVSIDRTGRADKAAVIVAPTASKGELKSPSSIGAEISSFSALSGLSIIVLVWAAVVLAIATSLGYATLVVRRIVNGARPLDTEDWLTPLWEVSDRLSL